MKGEENLWRKLRTEQYLTWMVVNLMVYFVASNHLKTEFKKNAAIIFL